MKFKNYIFSDLQAHTVVITNTSGKKPIDLKTVSTEVLKQVVERVVMADGVLPKIVTKRLEVEL